MSQRSRGRGRGRGGDGAWTWNVVTSHRGRGGRGRGKGGSPDYIGHDTSRHVIRSDHVLKSKRAGPAGFKGGGKGRFKGGRDERGGLCDAPVTQVPDEGIARHCEIRNAHKAAIEAIAMTEQGIFTASQDRTMKRWKPVRNSDGRFELQPELEVKLPESCFSLLFNGGWFFCGLWDGSIRAFSQDGAETSLKGHTKRVTSLVVHQNVLISGSADREVRLWQAEASGRTFSCTHTISDSMPGPISKLHVLGGYLFVGGMSGVAMLKLDTLEVTKLLPPVKGVADFLEFQGHLIVAYSEGGLRVFDAEGELKSDMKQMAGGPILSMAGLESGPRVLCGHSRGQISTVVLPSFTFKTQFQALDGHKVQSLLCAGHDGIFAVGSQDGTLQLWQRLGGP